MLCCCCQTEFMVDMKCEGCVNAVKNKLETIEGIRRSLFYLLLVVIYSVVAALSSSIVMENFDLKRY